MGTRFQAVVKQELKRLDRQKKSLRRNLALIAEKQRYIRVLLRGDGDSSPCSSGRVRGSRSTRTRKRATTRVRSTGKCMGMLPAVLGVIDGSQDKPLTTRSIAERLVSQGWHLHTDRNGRVRTPRTRVGSLLSQYRRTGYVVVVTRGSTKRSGDGHTWELTEHGRWRLSKADKMIVKSKFMGSLEKGTHTVGETPGKFADIE